MKFVLYMSPAAILTTFLVSLSLTQNPDKLIEVIRQLILILIVFNKKQKKEKPITHSIHYSVSLQTTENRSHTFIIQAGGLGFLTLVT